MVPQLVICHKCSAVLYESIEDLKAPDEIIQRYGGKCPTCGKKLSYIPIDFDVKPIEETKQLSSLETEQKRPSKKSQSETRKRERKRNAQATNRNQELYGRKTKKRKKEKESLWNELLPLLWNEVDLNTTE